MKHSGAYPSMMRAEVDLPALAHNIRELRRVADPSAAVMGVVKADGYGHGAVQVSRVVLDNGADYLAVARMSEVVQLREGGIGAPVLLFGYCSPEYVGYLAVNDVRASAGSLQAARELSDAAALEGVRLKLHIKVDTGMGRLGVVSDRLLLNGPTSSGLTRAVSDILKIAKLPNLDIEGIYTHFACADSADKSSAEVQLSLFMDLLDELKRNGFEAPIRHAANSAATIEMPESHLDMVRPGVSQYGLWPSMETNRQLIDLQPVMSLKSSIIQVKDVPAGFRVSYGSTHETTGPTRIATIPVGYADGYSRLLSSRGTMLVGGTRVPIIGRVCMDLTMVDVGEIDGVQEGDEVVLLGRQGSGEITAEEIAGLLDTINYEVVSVITPRVERVYKK